MKKTNLILGLFLVLILCAAPRGAGAQAATEYGLAAGSSATSVSGAGTTLNRKLDQAVNGTISHGGAVTVVHNTQASGSKVKSTNGQSAAATATHRVTKKTSVDGSGPAAQGAAQSGFTIVGAEKTSSESRGVAHTSASQSGFTVVGAEPQ